MSFINLVHHSNRVSYEKSRVTYHIIIENIANLNTGQLQLKKQDLKIFGFFLNESHPGGFIAIF